MNLPIRAVQYAMPAVRLRIDDSDDAVNPFVSLCQSMLTWLMAQSIPGSLLMSQFRQLVDRQSVHYTDSQTRQTNTQTIKTRVATDKQICFGRTDGVFAFRHRYLVSQLFQNTCARRK